MQWKEKFLALAIVIVFYYLMTNLVGQAFGQNTFMPGNAATALYVAITLAVIGLVAIVISIFLIKIDSISSGIMFGGILVLATGAGYYYFLSQTQLEKTAILAAAFVVLIAVGYFKFAKKATPATLTKQA